MARSVQDLVRGHRAVVFLLLWAAYTAFHASRKAPSIVRSVLHPASPEGEDLFDAQRNPGWAPFSDDLNPQGTCCGGGHGRGRRRAVDATDLAPRIAGGASWAPWARCALLSLPTGRFSSNTSFFSSSRARAVVKHAGMDVADAGSGPANGHYDCVNVTAPGPCLRYVHDGCVGSWLRNRLRALWGGVRGCAVRTVTPRWPACTWRLPGRTGPSAAGRRAGSSATLVPDS